MESWSERQTQDNRERFGTEEKKRVHSGRMKQVWVQREANILRLKSCFPRVIMKRANENFHIDS